MSKTKEIPVSSIAAFNKDGKLLFGLRRDAKKWTLPGGHANKDESPEKCAVRELLEETGLRPTELEFVGDGRAPYKSGDVRISAFRAKVDGEPTAHKDPDNEISEFRWVDVSNGLPDEIARNLFSPMNVTLRLLGLQHGKLLKVEFPEIYDDNSTVDGINLDDLDTAIKEFLNRGGGNTQKAYDCLAHVGRFANLTPIQLDNLAYEIPSLARKYRDSKAKVDPAYAEEMRLRETVANTMGGSQDWFSFIKELNSRIGHQVPISQYDNYNDATHVYVVRQMLEEPQFASLKQSLHLSLSPRLLDAKLTRTVGAVRALKEYKLIRAKEIMNQPHNPNDSDYDEDSLVLDNKSRVWHGAIQRLFKELGTPSRHSPSILEYHAQKVLDSPEMRAEIGDPRSPDNEMLVENLIRDFRKVNNNRSAKVLKQINDLLGGTRTGPDIDPIEQTMNRSHPGYRLAVNALVEQMKPRMQELLHAPTPLAILDIVSLTRSRFPSSIVLSEAMPEAQREQVGEMFRQDPNAYGKVLATATTLLERDKKKMVDDDNQAFLLNPASYPATGTALATTTLGRRRSNSYTNSKALTPEILRFAVEHEKEPSYLIQIAHNSNADESVWEAALKRVHEQADSASKEQVRAQLFSDILQQRSTDYQDSGMPYPSARFINKMLNEYPILSNTAIGAYGYLPYSTVAMLLTEPTKFNTYNGYYADYLLQSKPDPWHEENASKFLTAAMPLIAHEIPYGRTGYDAQRRALLMATNLIADNHVNLETARAAWQANPKVLSPAFSRRTDFSQADGYEMLKHAEAGGEIINNVLKSDHSEYGMVEWVLNNKNNNVRHDMIQSIVAGTDPRADRAKVGTLFTHDLQERLLQDGHTDEIELVANKLDKDVLNKVVETYPYHDAIIAKATKNLYFGYTEAEKWLDKREQMSPRPGGDWNNSTAVYNVLHALRKKNIALSETDSLRFARLPNPYDRSHVASETTDPAALKLLATDVNEAVRMGVLENTRIMSDPNIRNWLATEAPNDVLQGVMERGRDGYNCEPSEYSDFMTRSLPRILQDPQTMKRAIQTQGAAWFKENMDQFMTAPGFTFGPFKAALDNGAFNEFRKPDFEKMVDHILTSPVMAENRGAAMDHFMGYSFTGHMNDYFYPTKAQIGKMLDNDEALGPTYMPSAALNANDPSYGTALLRIFKNRGSGHLIDDDILMRGMRHHHPEVRAAMQRKIGPINPDAIHSERVKVRFDTGKLRAIRDLIEATGKDSMPAKDLPPMEWEVPVRDEFGNVVKKKVQKRTGYAPDPAGGMDENGKPKRIPTFKETEEVVKQPLPVRDPKGNISASMIQKYIDTLPFIEFNISHGKWGHGTPEGVEREKGDSRKDEAWIGGQRHNLEYSKVFQLNITNHHVNKMREKGSWQTYRNQATSVLGDHVEQPSHPVRPEQTTIGWVRYTGNPKDGLFVDEIQSDFGQSFIRRAVQQATTRAQAAAAQRTFATPNERAQFIEDQIRETRAYAESKWPDEHNKHIAEILFGGRHSNEVIHEAFHQYLRDRGYTGAKIAIHTPESKAPLSGLQTGNELPAHFKITYHDVPKKMGYQPATYGSLPTQNNSEIQELPEKQDPNIGKDKNQKWSASKATFETVVRKYEAYSYGLDCFYVLGKADDLAEDAQRKFEADKRAKWREFFLNPETDAASVVRMMNGTHFDSEESFRPAASEALEMLKRRDAQAKDKPNDPNSRRMDYLQIAETAVSAFGGSNDPLIEEVIRHLPEYNPNAGPYDGDGHARRVKSILGLCAEKASAKMLHTLLEKYTDPKHLRDGSGKGEAVHSFFHKMLYRSFDHTLARLFLPYADYDGGLETQIMARLCSNAVGGGSGHVPCHDVSPELTKIFDEIANKWADNAKDPEYKKGVLRQTVFGISKTTLKHILTLPFPESWTVNALQCRKDLTPEDLNDLIDHKDLDFNRPALSESLVHHESFNHSHFRKIFENPKLSGATNNLFSHARPEQVPRDIIQNVLNKMYTAAPRWDDIQSQYQPYSRPTPELTASIDNKMRFDKIMDRKFFKPEDIDSILDINSKVLTSFHLNQLAQEPQLTGAQINKMLQHNSTIYQGGVSSTLNNLIDHPNFDRQHLEFLKHQYLESGAHNSRFEPGARNHYILQNILRSKETNTDDYLEMLNKPDQYSFDTVNVELRRTPFHAFKNPAIAKWYYKNPDSNIRGDWAEAYGYIRRSQRGLPSIIEDPNDMREALSDPAMGENIASSHTLSPDMMRYVATDCPPATVHAALSNETDFPPDALHAAFNRMVPLAESLDKAMGDGSNIQSRDFSDHPGFIAPNVLAKLTHDMKDLTPEQLVGLVDKFKNRWHNICTYAIDHPNFPSEKIREIARWPDASNPRFDTHPANAIREHARGLIGLEDPDAVHNERVHIKFDIGKHRVIRDRIAGTGKDELMPKEIPGLPNGWKVGRMKNGNISAKGIQEEIDKAPASMYNISHSEYGEEAELNSRSANMECSDCSGSGNVSYDREETCSNCEGNGMHPDKTCHKCGGNGACPGKCDDGLVVGADGEKEDCSQCGGGGSGGQCDYCDGDGNAPPPCEACDGKGRVGTRRCYDCKGDGKQRCNNCGGSGEVHDEGEEECSTCDGSGEVEDPDYDPEGDQAWQDQLGRQQHNLKASKVLQVNFTTDQVKKMKEAGVWGTFRNMYGAYEYNGHPVSPTTIGWVRYTYNDDDKDPRYFVDEIQSDFGQSFVRQAVADAIKEGKQRAAQERIPFNTPQWVKAVTDFAEQARLEAEKKWPEAHHKKIAEILFGNRPSGKARHSNEILYEAFKQHLRDKGHYHAKMTIHHLITKAGISLGHKLGEMCKNCKQTSAAHAGHRDFDSNRFNMLNPSKALDKCSTCKGSKEHEGGPCSLCAKDPDGKPTGMIPCKFQPSGVIAQTDAPGHFNVTYHDIPLADGMEPAQYGKSGNNDEDNPQLKGKPTWVGPVRKHEEEYWGIPSRNLHKVDDPFEDAQWTYSI